MALQPVYTDPNYIASLGGQYLIDGQSYLSIVDRLSLTLYASHCDLLLASDQTVYLQGRIKNIITTPLQYPVGSLVSGYVLTSDGVGNASWQIPATHGTVTSVSVVSANGFAGSVANPTTTPAITLTTTITGVLKGNGSAILAATDADITGKLLTGYVSGAGTITATDSILTAIDKLNGNIQLLSGAIIYQGTWNANTNTPTLTSGVGTKGYLYKVSVAGTTNLDGINVWNVGDSAVFDGTVWDKIDGITSEVLSVNGLVGAVPLTGTANRITVSGANVFDISASYVGQTSITTLGTIGTGIWQGTAIATAYIANNAVTYAKMQQASTVTLLGNPTGGTANIQEITLGTGLSFSGSVLNAAGSITGTGAQYQLTVWTSTTAIAGLSTGLANQMLQSGGASANPAWSTNIWPATNASGDIIYGSATNVISTLAIGTNGQKLKVESNLPSWVNDVGSFGVTVDGQTAVCTTGQKGYIVIPYACTITGWSITASGSSPTGTFDIWKVATGTALPTVSNTIINTGAGGVKPAISSGNVIESTSLAHWTTAVAAGDIIGFNLDSVTVATRITLQLTVNAN